MTTVAGAILCSFLVASCRARVVDNELTALANSLWRLDTNRCRPLVDYAINKQGRVTSSGNVTDDLAPSKLFSTVKEDVVLSKSTYSKFVKLLDNYEASTSLPETVTAGELAENSAFLDAVMNTTVMQEAHRFLVSKGKATSSTSAFKQLLTDTWFRIFKRKVQDRYNNSCAFEHIFVGETEGTNVLGLHNWLAFYFLEKAGKVNYLGYHQRGAATSNQPLILTSRFIMQSKFQKSIGGFFLGTSPEFELALYTTCFLVDKGSRIGLTLNGTAVDMIVHSIGQYMGTVYPSQP